VKDIVAGAQRHGIKRTLVLGHTNHYKIVGEGYEYWPKYIDKVVEEIDRIKDYKDRPLLLFGHSKGTEVALSLATRLSTRVLKVYVVANGPILLGQATAWERLSADFKKSGEAGMLRWLASLQPENAMLGKIASLPPEAMREEIAQSKWLRETVELMTVQYKDAAFPRMRGDSPDIGLLSCALVAVSPTKDMGALPHVVEKWAANTTGCFQMITVNATHMGCLEREAELMDRLGPDMANWDKDPEICPPIPYRSAREEEAVLKLKKQGEDMARLWIASMDQASKKVSEDADARLRQALTLKNNREEEKPPAPLLQNTYHERVYDIFASKSSAKKLLVDIDGKKGNEEEIYVDPKVGPLILRQDGSMIALGRLAPSVTGLGPDGTTAARLKEKQWLDMTSTEQKIWAHFAAKKNKALKARFPNLIGDLQLREAFQHEA